MKRKGLAAVYDKPNTPFRLREYPLRDVKDDEVLVRDRARDARDTQVRAGVRCQPVTLPWARPALLGIGRARSEKSTERIYSE